jgi:hypothetical protein
MEYTVAGGPRDSSARPSKKVILSSMLMDLASGRALAPIAGGSVGTTADALLSECLWPLDWTVSITGGVSVKKLGVGMIRVPGMILPSLKGDLERCWESGTISEVALCAHLAVLKGESITITCIFGLDESVQNITRLCGEGCERHLMGGSTSTVFITFGFRGRYGE